VCKRVIFICPLQPHERSNATSGRCHSLLAYVVRERLGRGDLPEYALNHSGDHCRRETVVDVPNPVLPLRCGDLLMHHLPAYNCTHTRDNPGIFQEGVRSQLITERTFQPKAQLNGQLVPNYCSTPETLEQPNTIAAFLLRPQLALPFFSLLILHSLLAVPWWRPAT